MTKDLEDKEKFIQLRAKGLSFDKIAKQIKISKPTLLKWSEFLKSPIWLAKEFNGLPIGNM